jgi:type II secretory pathway component GspD/PulD (secretin)
MELDFQVPFALGQPSSSRPRAALDSNLAAGAPFVAATGTSPLGATLSIIRNRVGPFRNFNAILTAAESEGKIRVISRPSVVTLNNVASTIQSLRIVRVTLPTSTNIASGTGAAAGSAVATEKIPVGIILTVTPQVSSDGFVLLNISVKSSTITAVSAAGGAIGDELSREAISNVLIRDGETVVIGGIMKDTSQHSEAGVPYLKDIPFFGWLFKRIRWQKDFEELVVFITPRIVSGGSENLPTAERLWREQMKKTEGG